MRTASTAQAARPVLRSRFRGWWKFAALPFLFFLAVPLLALFLRTTPGVLVRHLGDPAVLQAIELSLVTSIITVLLTVLLGTPVAYYLSHRHYRFYRLVETLVELPTVLPPAVAGLALLMAFGRRGLIGQALSVFGISLPFTPAAVVMAQLFVAAPLYIRAAALGLQAIDCDLKKSAALDGANRWQIFWHIMLPMSWTGFFSGGVLTWARALGEFGATVIFAGSFPGRTRTMPLAIYLGFEIDLEAALALSVILVIVSFAALMLVKYWFYRTVEPPSHENDDCY